MHRETSYRQVNLETGVDTFRNFCYIVIDRASSQAAVIDPAWELEPLIRTIREFSANLTTVLLTHSHYDHVNILRPLLREYDCRVYMHTREIEYYNFKCQGLHPFSHLDRINLGQTDVTCLFTPGHTAGSACFLLSRSIFTGDTIFIESCGTCDTTGGSPPDMYDSIQLIKTLVKPDVHVYPGHSYGREPGHPMSYLLKNNIYFHIENKDEFIKYCRQKDQKARYRSQSNSPTTPPKTGPLAARDKGLKQPSSIADEINPASLGDEEFKTDYQVRYAYAAGGMYRGISSGEFVTRMAKAGLLSFFGTGGLELHQVEQALRYLCQELNNGQPLGMNVLADPMNPATEEELINLFLQYGIKNIEVSGYMQITPALVEFRAKGLKHGADGEISVLHKVMAKVTRPEIAEKFLSPAPEPILQKLIRQNAITRQQAALARKVPMADDLSAAADSAGHTDQGVAYALLPAMMKLRDRMMAEHGYGKRVRIGAAGGIGTPGAAAAAFILGADFILTGSINQCTVEAGTSTAVKDLLQQMNVQDTDYVPASSLFEMGARVQVLKRGLFFPARAKKLYELYSQYNSLDEIKSEIKTGIQENYFKQSFQNIYRQLRALYPPEEIDKAERNPRHKMALIFKWYLDQAFHLAIQGNETHKLDYQVFCSPALGAFNQWVKGTELENWRNRHADEIAEKLIHETAELLNQRLNTMIAREPVVNLANQQKINENEK